MNPKLLLSQLSYKKQKPRLPPRRLGWLLLNRILLVELAGTLPIPRNIFFWSVTSSYSKKTFSANTSTDQWCGLDINNARSAILEAHCIHSREGTGALREVFVHTTSCSDCPPSLEGPELSKGREQICEKNKCGKMEQWAG